MQAVDPAVPPARAEHAQLLKRVAQSEDGATPQAVRLLPAGWRAYTLVDDRFSKPGHPRALERVDDRGTRMVHDARRGCLDGVGSEALGQRRHGHKDHDRVVRRHIDNAGVGARWRVHVEM